MKVFRNLLLALLMAFNSSNIFALSDGPWVTKEETFEKEITESIDLGLIGIDLGAGDDILYLGNTEDSESGRITNTIDGGDGFDTLILENVDSWVQLSDIEKANIINFELVIFSKESGRQSCQLSNGSCVTSD